MDDGYLRIGEFSERVGVSPDLLRAWERRYGVLEPDRSEGGFRLYTDRDVERVERMTALMDDGLSAAEAARLAIAGVEVDVPAGPLERPISPERIRRRLHAAVDALDEAETQRILDEVVTAVDLETVLREVVMPFLREIGDRWAAGELSVGQEHFASNVLRGRLMATGRGWGLSTGPTALLASPPGEDHDLGLLTFGLALWRRGWRIVFLGADTPTGSIADVTTIVRCDLVVIAALDTGTMGAIEAEIAALAADVPVAIGGRGATAELAERTGARHLETDPVTAAEHVARAGGGKSV